MLMAAERVGPATDGAIRARRLSALPGAQSASAQQSMARENGAARAQLARIQRARILAGALDAACERGAANVSVADIVSRCGVSRRTFYETFSDRDDCFLAAFQDSVDLATERVLAAVHGEHTWIAKLRAGITAFLGFLEDEPKLGRLLLCDSLAAGPLVLERRGEVTERLAVFLYEGRESKFAAGTPRMQAEGSVGGVLAILHNLLLGERSERFVELAPALTAMVTMPFLGPRAAQRELERPVVELASTPSPAVESLSDPFKHAGMRLTYRTVHLLCALAEHPGSSNRTLGELAGIRDQGQISKLLARLKRFGLIDTTTPDRAQGAPNSWILTPAGQRLSDSILQHTSIEPRT
jgi:AcrR family transcriptional regulator